MDISLFGLVFSPAKADGAKQRAFYDEILEPLMNKAKAGQMKLFFMDASHFVMGGFSGSIWTKTRRYVQTASGRERYNVLGALDFVSKKVETITNRGFTGIIDACVGNTHTVHKRRLDTLISEKSNSSVPKLRWPA